MAELFGTNGIRGVPGVDLSLEFIHDITLALSAYFKKGPVLVGHDGRESSPAIAKTVCSTFNYTGRESRLAGLLPTPCLEYAVARLGYSGGVMVTASHNPTEYNGIKPVSDDGVEVSREDEMEIEEIYFGRTRHRISKGFGTTGTEPRAIPAYLDGIKSHVNLHGIRQKRLKVVLDIGNGAQAVTAPELCRQMGCDVITINEKVDPAFPGRGPEPTPENLSELARTVRRTNADLGVAFDGDGDRSLFCDENGCILSGDRSALLLAGHILHGNPGSTVVTCLNSGSSIEELAGRSGSRVIRTRVGSVEVSRRMVREGALLGYEENGGFIYGRHNRVRDGAMTLALVLDMLASSHRSISELTSEIPPSYTAKTKIAACAHDAARVIEVLKSKNPGADSSDGIKMALGGRRWVMVRPSGTEPIIRIYAEAESQDVLEGLITEYTEGILNIFKTNTK